MLNRAALPFPRFTSYMLVLVLLWCCGSPTMAQKSQKGKTAAPPTTEPAAPAPTFKLFFEKVYLHLDRPTYAAGEDLWFKAYLVDGQSNYLTSTSHNLYVDLISPAGAVTERRVLRLNQGTATGDFALPDSLPGGNYRIRAYTNWMLNFEREFFFEREIEIHSLANIRAPLPVATAGQPSLRFFPEGGALVEGVATVVALKAVNGLGQGTPVKGSIVTGRGDVVARFEGNSQGLGSFSFLPVPGEQYQVVGTYADNSPLQAQLPAALAQGLALQVVHADTASLLASISLNPQTMAAYAGKEVILAGRNHGKTYFTQPIRLSQAQTTIRVPKHLLPPGIASLTLYDDQARPHCERLVYLPPRNPVTVQLTTDKPTYRARDKVTVRIKATDALNRPVRAELSLAALDATLVPAGVSDIVSYLMLESEVKGPIENPGQYFKQSNPHRERQLDLLLLTQGWRDFLWRRLLEDKPMVKYLPEPGITVSGRVRQSLGNKPLPDLNISLFAPGATGNKLFSTQTDAEGRFFLDGLALPGQQRLILTATNKKGQKTGLVLLDSLFAQPLAAPALGPVLVREQPEAGGFVQEVKRRRALSQQYKLANTIVLQEVVISAAAEKEQKQLNLHRAASGYPDYNIALGEHEKQDMNMGFFLMSKLPGTQLRDETFRSSRAFYRIKGENGAMARPIFYVNGTSYRGPMGEDFVYNLPMAAVERVVISYDNMAVLQENEIFGGDDASYGPTNLRGTYVISVFTDPNAVVRSDVSVVHAQVKGYYEAREFYAPDYDQVNKASVTPDLRTTIFWAPRVVTDEKGEATATFFQPDQPTRVRLAVEGISDKGLPLTGEGQYEGR